MSEDLPASEEDQSEPTSASDLDRPPKSRRRSRSATVDVHDGTAGGLMGSLGGVGGSGKFEVESPDELSTFDDVGGMEQLKQEVRQTVGLMLEHPDEAERYGIEWNGILLHGPPGVGKTSSRARSPVSTG